MKQKFQIFIVFLFALSCNLKSQSLQGFWKDEYMDPMDWYYYFDTINGTFKSYYLDDLNGSFGKGHFLLKENKIQLTYDSIECDKPTVEIINNSTLADTTQIDFFYYGPLPIKIDLLKEGKVLATGITQEIPPIIEYYLKITIPEKLDSVAISIYSGNKLISTFPIQLYQNSQCNIYYFPCNNSYFDYEGPSHNTLNFKWITDDTFVIGKKKFKMNRVK